jgi:hypothetical protein
MVNAAAPLKCHHSKLSHCSATTPSRASCAPDLAAARHTAAPQKYSTRKSNFANQFIPAHKNATVFFAANKPDCLR